MTDNERDPKVAAAYRGLAQPEPPARLDDAILAASRRTVRSGPRASRAGPRSAVLRRWSVPLSLAAAVVLSVMVTLRVQDETPEIASPTAQAPSTTAQAPSTPRQAPTTPAPAPATPEKPALARADPAQSVDRKPAAALPDAMREAPRDESRLPKFSPDPGPAAAERRADAAPAEASAAASPAPAAARAPAATPPPPAKPAPQGSLDVRGASSGRAPAGIAQDQARDRAASNAGVELAKRAEEVETPERQLERIATLRREGKHADADKLLADFKQRYPQYRIPEATLEKVLPPR